MSDHLVTRAADRKVSIRVSRAAHAKLAEAAIRLNVSIATIIERMIDRVEQLENDHP